MIWLLPLLTALGLVACLGLFLSLKAELSARVRDNEDRLASMLNRLDSATVNDAPDEWETTVIPLRSGINLNRRGQAVRLLRRGENVAHVAAALAVPRAEIELLIRVQEMTAQRAAEAAPSLLPKSIESI